MTVYDQCLDSPDPATAHIRVSDIDSILLTVVDKVRRLCNFIDRDQSQMN